MAHIYPVMTAPPFNTMDNNRSFMDDKDGCEVFCLYKAGIPGILIHPQFSKLSPGGWFGHVYITAERDIKMISQVKKCRESRHHGKAALLLLLHILLYLSALLTLFVQVSSLGSVIRGLWKNIQFLSDTLNSTVIANVRNGKLSYNQPALKTRKEEE